MTAKAWYFANPNSLAYLFYMLGSTFFVFPALTTGLKLFREKGIPRRLSWLFWLVGLLMITGFFGYISGNSLFEKFIVAGQGLTMFLGVFTSAWGLELKKND